VLTVVKAGGRVLSRTRELAQVAEAIGAMPGAVVVVHGGGDEVSSLQERLGLDFEFRDGLRVTSPEGLKAASMALSGWANKRLVGALRTSGLDAAGVSGEDGALVSAFVKNAGRLGEVGTVAAIQPGLVETLLEGGFTPVVSPLSSGPGGRPLNVNADEVAGALSVALAATRLFMVSDAPGVVDVDGVVPRLTLNDSRALLDSGVASGGMRVKLLAAMAAVRDGVTVRIGDVDILSGDAGTQVVSEARRRDVA